MVPLNVPPEYLIESRYRSPIETSLESSDLASHSRDAETTFPMPEDSEPSPEIYEADTTEEVIDDYFEMEPVDAAVIASTQEHFETSPKGFERDTNVPEGDLFDAYPTSWFETELPVAYDAPDPSSPSPSSLSQVATSVPYLSQALAGDAWLLQYVTEVTAISRELGLDYSLSRLLRRFPRSRKCQESLPQTPLPHPRISLRSPRHRKS